MHGLAVEESWADRLVGNSFYVYSHSNANIFWVWPQPVA